MVNQQERNITSVGVFCGSAEGNLPAFVQAAKKMGQLLAQQHIRVVYGGGNVGLMGALADGTLLAGGEVTGVITKKLVGVELAHMGVKDMRVVETMDERKSAIVELSDAFIAMPGGYGTYDELFEVLALCQLHIIKKPVGLLNTAGYFEAFHAMVAHGIKYGFIRSEHNNFFVIDENETALLEKLNRHDPPETLKWLENFSREKR